MVLIVLVFLPTRKQVAVMNSKITLKKKEFNKITLGGSLDLTENSDKLCLWSESMLSQQRTSLRDFTGRPVHVCVRSWINDFDCHNLY